MKEPTPSAIRSPMLAVLPGVKDWWISSDNPYKVDKIIAANNRNPLEYLRLRLKIDLAIRKPKIEYPTMCNSLSFKEIGGFGKGLEDEDMTNMRRQ